MVAVSVSEMKTSSIFAAKYAKISREFDFISYRTTTTRTTDDWCDLQCSKIAQKVISMLYLFLTFGHSDISSAGFPSI